MQQLNLMQPITKYATSEAYLRLLLQGSPGSGKTTLGCQFPGAYVADCDLNLAGPLRFLQQTGRTLPVGYDTIDRDENGKEVPLNGRYIRLMQCLTSAANDPAVQTLVVDSATKVSDYIMADVLREQNKSEMSIQLWGFYLRKWMGFISQLSVLRKNFVLIAHERVEKDEVDQSLKYFIMLPGQIGNIIGSLFTDVWRCEVAENMGKYSWLIRTMPSYRFILKNSLGLPPTFEFKWETIAAKLAPSHA